VQRPPRSILEIVWELPKPTKRDAERAQKQLARVSLAIRRLGRNAKRN